jgi:hypothetical protein
LSVPTTIAAGGEVRKDPADLAVFRFDWDAHFAAGVSITGTPVWSITCVNDEPTPTLTADSKSNTARTATARLLGGTAGKKYQVACKVTTDESPQQTKERSFFVVVADL